MKSNAEKHWDKWAKIAVPVLGWKSCTGMIDYLVCEYNGKTELVHLQQPAKKIREEIARVIMARKKQPSKGFGQ